MDKTTSLSTAMKAAQTVREAAAELTARRASLELEAQALRTRNEHLRSLPVRREDAKTFVLDSIDRIGEEFINLERWGKAFKDFAYPAGGGRKEARGAPLSLRDIDQVSSEGGNTRAIAAVVGADCANLFFGPNGGILTPMAPPRLYFFFGDVIKAKVEQHFEALFPTVGSNDPETAMPLSERRAEIDRNAARVSAIGSEISEIDAQRSKLSVAS